VEIIGAMMNLNDLQLEERNQLDAVKQGEVTQLRCPRKDDSVSVHRLDVVERTNGYRWGVIELFAYPFWTVSTANVLRFVTTLVDDVYCLGMPLA
jgi:hypothetical protein